MPDVACKQILCIKYTSTNPGLVSDRKSEILGKSSLPSKLAIKIHLLHIILETEKVAIPLKHLVEIIADPETKALV